MIKKIILKYFGKYTDRVFDLSPVTVFIGKNESGKTTLFDAIFDCLCRPNNKISHGKRLKKRYGEEREAELIFDSKTLQLDPDQFLNLNAVHSGNTDLDFSSGNSWIDKIKSALFYGGIDPAPIIYELEQESSSYANKPHIKELKKTEQEKERIENELREITGKKEYILKNEDLIHKKNENLKNLESRIEDTNKQIIILKQQYEQQNKINMRNEYISLFDFFNKGEKLKEQLSGLKYFETDQSEEFDNIDREIKCLDLKLQEEKGFLHSLSSEIETRKRKLETKKREREAKRHLSEIAEILLLKIKNIETSVIKKTKWNPVLLVISAVLFVLGITMFLAVPGFQLKTIMLCTGLIAGIIILFLSKKDILVQDTSRIKNLIMEIKDEWKTRLKNAKEILHSETKDGLIRELIQYETEYDRLISSISEETAETEIKENEYSKIMKSISQISSEIENRKKTIESKLSILGLKNIYDYYKKLETYKNLTDSYKNWELELNKKLEAYNTDDLSILKTEIELKIRELNDEITEERITDAEVNKISRELNDLEDRLKGFINIKLNLEKDISENQGIVKGSLGDIPEKIVNLEKSKAFFEEKINEINLNMKAAGLAKEIFLKLSENMDTLMFDLQDQIREKFTKIIPDLREITVKKLDKDSITISDAGGSRRILDNLSRGTVDTFYLSVRLALLERTSKEESILILDEPFHSMDNEREIKTLELINEFRKNNNWQVILFTIDKSIENRIKDIFPDAGIYLLEQKQ